MTENLAFKTFADNSRPVCILGLGLIGGSLMRDIAAAGRSVYGWNRSTKTVEAAQAEGFDVSADLTETLRRAESDDALVVLGVPVPALGFLLEAIAQHAPSVCFTDVTSVKAEVHDLVDQYGLTERFIGGHPMAGTADSGWAVTTEGLFTGAVWVVTYDNAMELGGPEGDKSPERAAVARRWLEGWVRVVKMAQLVGADVVACRAKKHDSAVARISHLPHILAEALAIAGDNGGPLALSLAASSFRDGTRVAGTAPDLVRAMCENNREALVEALDESIALLMKARRDLVSDEHDLKALAKEGFAARSRFEARAGRTKGDHTNRPIIRVNPGAPGWINQLRSAASMGAQINIGE
ncbi:prephenate dehydrogenase [Corynebacterium anserum]|uniref:Prephenate dehydrogenase n=1 Tax=Corynebacterium anserum TaxID=2684406 RepID=A0A7G7YQI6_9CORY|nr:prephenate dehydrogenase [Corynebacterium anserum]MBC2682445.1 prephenate dehydrogenase [Corynebacterium anserum]QNH96756.1 prephenate dehydrogenase [Corynebacterium anserum]